MYETKDAGAAVGQGVEKELSAIETYKKYLKNHCQLCLFLFSNNVDQKQQQKL